jgi:hypothetical protein
MLRAGVFAACLMVAGCGTHEAPPPPPEVALARVLAAPGKVEAPGVIITVTRHEIGLDGSRVLEDPRGEVEPRPRAWFELAEVFAEENELRTQLELLRAVSHAMNLDMPRVRYRVAGDVRFIDVLRVVQSAADMADEAPVFEVATEIGVGQFKMRPYTYCGCELPPVPSWCAVPIVRIGLGGVTLGAHPDLTPPPGCHRAFPRGGERRPEFKAAVDWRERVIAGPQGGCPSAQVGQGGLDTGALARRLAAMHQAAPGCARASVDVDPEAPWSIVAPTLAALYTEFGEVRTFLDLLDEEDLLPAGACKQALPVEALRPAPPSPSPLQLRRRGCGE